jgi:hypothetical protein
LILIDRSSNVSKSSVAFRLDGNVRGQAGDGAAGQDAAATMAVQQEELDNTLRRHARGSWLTN